MLAAFLVMVQVGGTPHSRLEVMSSVQAAAPGIPFEVKLQVHLDEGWHTYWVNPGDSGSATEVKWTLPKGWKVSAPRYGIPHRIVAGDIVSYGYEEVAEVAFTVTPPVQARSGTLAGDVSWLVCKETCLPASQRFRVPIKIAKSALKAPEYIPAAPKPPMLKATAKSTKKGFVLRAVIPSAEEGLTFFGSDPGVIDPAAEQVVQPEGTHTEIFLSKSAYAPATTKRLRGLIVFAESHRAYSIDVPITP